MKIHISTGAAFLLFASQAFAQQAPQLGKNPVKEVIAAMTLDEKVALIKGIGMNVANGENGPVVGIIDGKVIGAAGATMKIPRLGIPEIIVADGPAGLRIEPVKIPNTTQINFPTSFPMATAIASSWNTQLANRVGKAMGSEVLEFGVDIILGPGANIQRDLLCGRNFEYYSEDPVITGNMAAAFINGIQSNNVGTSIKHFAANNQETNRNSVDAVVGQRALREIYLKGFEIALKKSNPWTVMSSYNKINGTYASENYDLLTTILRNEWSYKGLVMTDWYAGKAYPNQVKAGNDLLMPGRKQESIKIKAAIENKELSLADLDRNVENILNLILKTPTFKNYRHSNIPNYKLNAQIAKETAAEGMILLKNVEALPLKKKKIALLGNASYDTFIGGTGSGEVKSAHAVSFWEGLFKAGYMIDPALKSAYTTYLETEKAVRPKRMNILETIKPVDELFLDISKINALAISSEAAIITVGRNAGEGSDRSVDKDFNLSEREISLIKNTTEAFHKYNKKVVVALNIDALVDVSSWRNLVDGIIITWLPGQEAGDAFAEVVSGNTNPSGHLAQTIPLKYTDSPSSTSFPGVPQGRPEKSHYKEGIYVGYRYYSSFAKPVAYEFGYGLSYTQFIIEKLKTSSENFKESIKLTTTIKNTGKTAGKEVVQLYLSAPGKNMEKPEIELKGFEKTALLAPGKSQKITFELSSMDLASFDTARSAWIVEPGIYTIKIGSSSINISQTATFEVTQEIVVAKVNDVLRPQEIISELKKNR